MNTNTPVKIVVGSDKIMDVRSIPCSVKHDFIIKFWQGLRVGDHFILWNDHNPARLREQFATLWPETFAWEYLVEGPDEFRIKITKLKPLPAPAEAVADCSCGSHV